MPRGFLAQPTADTDALRERFAPIFARIAAGSVEREQERRLPYDEVRWLLDASFGVLRVPERFGGLGASLQQTYDLLVELGAADPNVAHVLRNHLAVVEDRLNTDDTPENRQWIDRFVAGEFVGGSWTEANNGSVVTPKTIITDVGDHLTISGEKYYSTGSPYADWLYVLGRFEDGELSGAFVRVDQPGVTVIDDWGGFGQRMTGSGTTAYDSARIERHHLVEIDRPRYLVELYQIALLSALAGIVAAIERDGVTALQARKRQYLHATDEQPTADPQLLQVIGKLSAANFGARTALSAAGSTLDRVIDARLQDDDAGEEQAVQAAFVAISQAQLVIIEHALQAASLVFDALGSSGVSEKLRLDRHWRNARTIASHNPRVYKERLLGDWLVNGIDPANAGSPLPPVVAKS